MFTLILKESIKHAENLGYYKRCVNIYLAVHINLDVGNIESNTYNLA